jgi:lipopolysaccharide export system ATP-binding protein
MIGNINGDFKSSNLAAQSNIEESILFMKNIEKYYGDKLVIKNINLSFKTGEICAIMGPNGAGKTTSFYMITGIIKPTKGSIFLNNIDITKLPIYIRARLGIGYLPQENSIFKGLTTKQNILLALECVEKDKKKQKQKLDELIETFHLTKVANSLGGVLSGGERRRTEVARCVATNPKFILLDEPFAGVDPVSVEDVEHLINDLVKKNIGVIITDHNVRETLKIAHRSYIFYDGIVICKGNADDILSNKTVKEKYLGHVFD